MNGPLGLALLIAFVIATFLGWISVIGGGLLWIWLGGLTFAVALLLLARGGAHYLTEMKHKLKQATWAEEEGQHHSFAGVSLRVVDDGRFVWVAADSLMRALGQREAEDVMAARHAGQWQRDEKGQLMLRVDAVVQRLSTMPGRADPRVQRLRKYFEREVLYPAQRRHERR